MKISAERSMVEGEKWTLRWCFVRSKPGRVSVQMKGMCGDPTESLKDPMINGGHVTDQRISVTSPMRMTSMSSSKRTQTWYT
jgi:hypothetical protein